jgi:ribosomal protein S28E/S33
MNILHTKRYIVRRLYIIYTLLIISIFLPSLSLAQELVEDKIEVIKAVVLEVKDKDKELIPTFNIENKIQEVKAKITEGENKDREITFNNDFTPLSIGEVFYLNHTIDKDGSEYFAMLEPYRLDEDYVVWVECCF